MFFLGTWWKFGGELDPISKTTSVSATGSSAEIKTVSKWLTQLILANRLTLREVDTNLGHQINTLEDVGELELHRNSCLFDLATVAALGQCPELRVFYFNSAPERAEMGDATARSLAQLVQCRKIEDLCADLHGPAAALLVRAGALAFACGQWPVTTV